jgi:flagellar motor component MotA
MIAKGHFLFLTLSIGLIWSGFYIADLDAGVMVNFSSFFYLAGISVGLMAVAFPIKTHVDALRALLSVKLPTSCHTDQLVGYFRALGHVGLTSGFLGFTIAMAMLLERLNSPEELGPPVAIGIRCLAYGVIVRMVAMSIADRFMVQEERSSDNQSANDTTQKAENDDSRRAA